ncbi:MULTISPECIES: CobW family GTP-binding protein [unclassified Bartonella]|uniref:CobW family GTP-binding protein n=1 Tax=unclassified Bartonella TaxID=2645622 RepID=UPI00099ABA4D|nr:MULTISPECIES: GTP-binding protein [unclassified Bartonella]AQX28567.1 GTPase, G3E family [Bartonella sp. JB15]AQX29827.1 GTPase, G3E family [Bartonella sp. JB63]
MQTTRIPVTLITGFLGSGKTTVLNYLLRDPLLANSAVIINEFGEVSIDHLFVEKATEGIIELTNGCLCCNLRSDLIDTLVDLIDHTQTQYPQKLNRIIIETTGLADPAPILQAILSHPFLIQVLAIDAVIATFDALNSFSILEHSPEIQKQLTLADKIILTKTDLIDHKIPLDLLTNKLKALNPTAQIINSHSDQCKPHELINKIILNEKGDNIEIKKWLPTVPHNHSHYQNFRAFSLDYNEPIHSTTLEAFLDLLKDLYGEKLLRVKALIALHDNPHSPLVLHGVQTFFHPPIRLPTWPEEITKTRFVIITNGVEKEAIQKLFDACLNNPAIDTPDKAAMLNNPLIIPGVKF